MKITDFNVTLDLGKDDNGYSSNVYVNCRNGNVEVSRPYQAYPIEQAIAIEGFILEVIAKYKDMIKTIDNANKDLKLEQYAPIVQEEPKASTSLEDTTFG